MKPDVSIEGLLQAARGGDAAARDEFCRRFLPALRRWASRRLPAFARGLVDTDDLAQEALMRTIGRLDRVEGDGAGVMAYLRTAVLNRIRDEVRRAGRRPLDADVAPDGTEAAEPSPLRQAIGAETLDRYERALATLGPRDSEAVVLRLEMGLSFREIAEALAWPSSDAARMAVTRAVRQLAVSMSDERD